MLFQSRRFIEYFPAIGLVFTAFAWTPLILDLETGAGKTTNRGEHKQLQESKSWTKYIGRNQAVGALLVFSLIIGSAYALWNARSQLLDTKPAGLYAGASEWLIANTPQGSKVFQSDWDDFPRQFFHNTWNTYIIGLDPTYLQIKDPDLFDQWVAITRGEVDNPSEQIFEDFSAEYVMTDLAHQEFMDRAAEDQAISEVYRDDQAVIYQVRLPEG
jgi:hypothetical protein